MATLPFPPEAPLSLRGEGRRDRVSMAGELLERAWSRGLCDRPMLEPEVLLAAARRDAALTDFGDEADGGDGWRGRLHALTDALDREAALNAVGQVIAYGQIRSALASRLRAAALWRRHPEIASVPLCAPVIVVGQMRSGSTRMQRLLACDPRLTHTRFFESWNPVARWAGCPVDDRRVRGWTALTVAKLLNPRFGVIHPCRTGQADEEIGLHNIALYGAAFEAQWRIPSFAARGETVDARPVYASFRRQLQTIRWLRGRADDRPWILKLPQFAQDLDAVLSVFPDARIVVLHRDPVRVVGSSASLVHNQMTVQSDSADRAWIGREWLRKVALRDRRMRAARTERDVPSVDICFDAMREDWRAEIGRVYAMLGLDLPPAIEARMARFLGRKSHARLGRHTYDVADFGLTAAQIRTEMRL